MKLFSGLFLSTLASEGPKFSERFWSEGQWLGVALECFADESFSFIIAEHYLSKFPRQRNDGLTRPDDRAVCIVDRETSEMIMSLEPTDTIKNVFNTTGTCACQFDPFSSKYQGVDFRFDSPGCKEVFERSEDVQDEQTTWVFGIGYDDLFDTDNIGDFLKFHGHMWQLECTMQTSAQIGTSPTSNIRGDFGTGEASDKASLYFGLHAKLDEFVFESRLAGPDLPIGGEVITGSTTKTDLKIGDDRVHEMRFNFDTASRKVIWQESEYYPFLAECGLTITSNIDAREQYLPVVKKGCINQDYIFSDRSQFSLGSTDTNQDTFIWTGVNIYYGGSQTVTFGCKVNGCKNYGVNERCTPADHCKNSYNDQMASRRRKRSNDTAESDDAIEGYYEEISFILSDAGTNKMFLPLLALIFLR